MSDAHAGCVPLADENDVVRSRQTVRRLTQDMKFSLVDQTKLVTAASELSRNALVYGGGGEMRWQQVVSADGKVGLQLEFEDHGPGIPDVQLALTDGWTSGTGLGIGLSGARRLVNEFAIHTDIGQGTRVTITRWRSP